MSLVTPAQVKALVQTSLSDADLQVIIDREEGWLAGRIGALSGSRTETFYPRRGVEHLHLRRPTNSVTVTDGDLVDPDDYRLLYGGTVVERVTGSWGDTVTVTYTPNDSAAIATAIIDLIRLRTTDTGFVSERIGQYSYQTAQLPGARERTRRAILEGLRKPLCPHHRAERITAAPNP
jgi:hypothetical protein